MPWTAWTASWRARVCATPSSIGCATSCSAFVPRSPTAWSKIQPRLDADRDQIKLLGPAPAAGAPPEPEQAARNRAELNYHLGLLSAAEATVNSTNLRIDNLLDKIQDIRRKNFTSALFQPIPGLYAYETWANVPQYVPDAARRVRDLVADWWADRKNRADFARTALEALLMLIILSVASWRGIRQVAALARCRRAAVLAAGVFGRRRDPASRAPGRGACGLLIRHDRRHAGIAGARGLAVLSDHAIDRHRLHRRRARHHGICARARRNGGSSPYRMRAPPASAASSFCSPLSTA